MMATQTLLLLLLYSSLFILSLKTSVAKPYCAPSACGIIRNISYPFRLKDDPGYCGDPGAELACESYVTFLYVNSHKYYVKAINHTTIRVADVSINNNDLCSFPTISSYLYNYTFRNYGILRPSEESSTPSPINLISCSHPHPLQNLSHFTDVTHCQTSNASSPRFTYVKIGRMKASDVTESCSVDVIVMTSWGFRNPSNVSLQEIHHSLLYGFELDFCDGCRSSGTAWSKNIAT